MATARPVARPLEGRAVVARASCSYMTVLPRPCRRSALVGRALPGLDAGCRDAFVFAGCVAGFVVDCFEGGSEEPNAECCLLGRVDVAERMRSFLSARGICAVRFPSAVCLLMPDGSNDLGACGVVLREGPAVVARLVRAGYAPDIPRTSSNANLNSR